LNEVQARRHGAYKESTIPTILLALKKYAYPIIGNIPLAQIKNETLVPLVTKMHEAGLSICSQNNYLKVVVQVIRSLRDTETNVPIYNIILNRSLLQLPKIDSDDQHVPALVKEQIETLIHDSEEDEQALYVILAATGMRINEVLALEARHIVNNGRTISVEQSLNRYGMVQPGGKTKASIRPVDVTSEVAAYLREFIKDKHDKLFPTRRGSYQLAGNLRRRWLGKRLPDYGFHSPQIPHHASGCGACARTFDEGVGWSFPRKRCHEALCQIASRQYQSEDE
jgi:integrase